MSWKKEKHIVQIKGGCGQVITEAGRGLIQQFLVEPESKDTIWSMDILDRDGGCIYSVKDQEWQLNDRQGLPLGKDQTEQLNVKFYDLTRNEKIKVIFNIREIQ